MLLFSLKNNCFFLFHTILVTSNKHDIPTGRIRHVTGKNNINRKLSDTGLELDSVSCVLLCCISNPTSFDGINSQWQCNIQWSRQTCRYCCCIVFLLVLKMTYNVVFHSKESQTDLKRRKNEPISNAQFPSDLVLITHWAHKSAINSQNNKGVPTHNASTRLQTLLINIYLEIYLKKRLDVESETSNHAMKSVSLTKENL